MTLYNITKAKQVNETKDIKIDLLEKEIDKLNDINKELRLNCARDTENALILQKHELNEKHKIILREYSENLKIKYKINFDNAIKSYKNEIASLKNKLAEEKSSRLALSTRRPIYSPGRYTDPADLSLKGETTYPASSNTSSNVDRTFPAHVPYLEKLRKLRETAGLKPDYGFFCYC